MSAWAMVKMYRDLARVACSPSSSCYADSMRRFWVREAWCERKERRT